MFKPSEFTGCYVVEMHWVGNMKEATVRVKVTHKNVYKNYLQNLNTDCIIYNERTAFVYTYPAKDIEGENDEHVRFVYCESFVDAYRIVEYYKKDAYRLISMVRYKKQNSELGFDNLVSVDFGKEKINIDDYLN